MSGKVDALHVQLGAAGDFHVQHRERNRNTGPPIEHLVQKAVPRVLVVDVVADKVQLLEQVLVERHHARIPLGIDAWRRFSRHDRRGGHPDERLAADGVQLIEIGAGVEPGALDARDHQRRDCQVGVGAQCGMREAADEL